MTTESEVLRRAVDVAHSALSTCHADRLRTRLQTGMGEQTAQFAQHAVTVAALTDSASDATADRDHAMALHMYLACEALWRARRSNSISSAQPHWRERMATQPLGQEIGCNDHEDRREHVEGGRAYGLPPPTREPVCGAVAVAGDPLALAESRARHPSSARHEQSHDETTCPACGWTSTSASDAADAVRRLLALARQLLLRGGSDEERRHLLGRPRTLDALPLERVARLRDEFYATANRIARFGVDEHPIVDLVRIEGPTATSAALGPAQLLFQLEMSAGRLIALLEPLSSRDWGRSGGMGDRVVTLGELVDRVLHGAYHDLLDLMQNTKVLAPPGVAAMTNGRSGRDRRDAPLSRYSPVREDSRDAAAS